MSRRNLIRKYQVLTDGDSTGSPESEATDVSGVDKITYQIFLGASVSSIAEVCVCNDDRITDSSVFIPLKFNPSITLDANVDQEGFLHITNQGFKWIKIFTYTNGGSGLINIYITGESVGA